LSASFLPAAHRSAPFTDRGDLSPLSGAQRIRRKLKKRPPPPQEQLYDPVVLGEINYVLNDIDLSEFSP